MEISIGRVSVRRRRCDVSHGKYHLEALAILSKWSD